MPEGNDFTTCFWSTDYQTGLNVIFDKLLQGCAENTETLAMVQERINLETSYATGLQGIPTKQGPTSGGFDRDEGATLRQAYVSYLDEIKNQGLIHAEIANKLDRGVRGPFLTWSNSHKTRITNAQSTLNSHIKVYYKKEAKALKSQQVYFSKCRQLEDSDAVPLSEQDQGNNDSSSWASSIATTIQKRTSSMTSNTSAATAGQSPDDMEDENITLAGHSYSPEAMAKLLDDMLRDIPYGDFKIPILGTYTNVSTGDEIVMWARKRLNCKNVGRAEKFGQGLIDSGFLKAVGRVGSKFVNSSSYGYQWTEKALDYDPNALFPDQEPPLSPTGNSHSVGEYFSGFLKAPPPTTSKDFSKLHQDIAEADARYRNDIMELDLERCRLEEAIVETLKFMEQCELDRIKAIKTVLGDYAHAVAAPMQKVPPVLSRLHQHQSAVNPTSDLSYMIESYKTATFAPKVAIYESFHSATKCQTFGVDLAGTGFFIPTILNYLESQQEETSLAASHWIESAPLASVHQLRNQINNGLDFDPLSILPSFPVHIVVATLKEYLLELQDSLISFTMYDVFKNIYQKDGPTKDHVIAALSHIPKQNITTLESIINHVVPLCKDDDKTISQMATMLGRFILRPRAITKATMSDKHPALLIEDLMKNRQEIFSAVYAKLSAIRARDRSVSTSEANRRANVEQRNREMVEKSVNARAARSRTGSPPTPPVKNSPYSHGHSSSVISSNGLLPLTLSPSREVSREGTITPNIKRISSSSLTTPSSTQSHQRHQKSYSTPIKSPIALLSTSRASNGSASPPSEATSRRERGRSFRGAAPIPYVHVPSIPDAKETDGEEAGLPESNISNSSIPEIISTPPQQFNEEVEAETPQDQIVTSDSTPPSSPPVEDKEQTSTNETTSDDVNDKTTAEVAAA